ncbi:MAG: phosphoglucomutase [Candidatus Margulisiibacteriota bacterium]
MHRLIHPLAGKKALAPAVINKGEILRGFYFPQNSLTPIKNSTSGHRGKVGPSFSWLHVAAMSQALVDLKTGPEKTFGPKLPKETFARYTCNQQKRIILGKDVRFASDEAQRVAAEVFAANGFTVIIHKGERATPTPVISHAILTANERGEGLEGGIITGSHNPPEEAGYKSNGLNGGPNTNTAPIDRLANEYLAHPEKIKRIDYEKAKSKGLIIEVDLISPYVDDISNVVKMDALKGNKFAVTPLGGSAYRYYQEIAAKYNLNIVEIFGEPDPAGINRTYDWDGKLRGDPSSPYVMKAVDGYLKKLGVPFIGANDNDADRFGGVDRTAGILNPNHVLAVLFDYLCQQRNFPQSMGIGRTIGTTHMLDKIAENYGRPVYEVNVGFKYYVAGLLEGKYILAGEESAGLSFPRMNGKVWVTEKDGIAAVLLMMEVIAHTGKDIGTLYGELVSKYGPYQYEREDTPATQQKKDRLNALAGNLGEVENLLGGKKIAGRSILRVKIGDGIKVELEGGVWVLKRASGTEDIIKDYREEAGDTIEVARKASEEIDYYLKLT